jgi:hypothetical protein
MNTAASKTLLMLILGFTAIQLGCVRAPTRSDGRASVSSARQILSAQDAAELAARLANHQCKRQFGRQPFSPRQHSAMLEDGLYHWGKLDVGGVGGFSAVVTFRADGAEPHVAVYFSSDAMVVR